MLLLYILAFSTVLCDIRKIRVFLSNIYIYVKNGI